MYLNWTAMLKIANSEDIIVIISGTVLLLLLGGFIISFLFVFKNRQQSHQIEKQRLENKIIEAVFEAKLEVRDQTLRTISQEIHDNIGQVLSLAKLNLNTIQLGDPEDAEEQITSTKKLVSKAIQDLRDLSHNINFEYYEDLEFIRALESDLAILERSGRIKSHLTIEGDWNINNKRIEVILFRVIQEALNNVVKHSEASQVNVTIKSINSYTEVRVQDNGKGFDMSKLFEEGIGIKNMKGRAKMLGATLDLESKPGFGCTVTIITPLNIE